MESQTKPVLVSSPQVKKIGKQGLRKQIITQGKSWQTPSRGDEVEVHFSGQIKGGAHIDSSWDRGIPFKFKLGQGEVIKGWDEGVVTMKKGERAIFTIPPSLAYGEVGSPPSVPPDSTLVFDIEMMSWTAVRDVTGDGGILKKVTSEGEGWATPKDGDEVLVKYKVSLENGTLVSESDGEEFYINDDYRCPAISTAVKTMRRGEKVELSVKFSYGFREVVTKTADTANGTVFPASNLTIELELVSWKSVIDITGDKKVVKKIVKPGEGFDHPNEGSLVKVAYIGRHEDGSVFEIMGSAEQPYEFVCLEEQANDWLDRAIITMKKGEQALLTVGTEYLSTRDVSRTISIGSVVYYEVQLIDFIKAVKYVEFDHSFNDDEKSIAKSLALSCHLNNAACKLKLEDCLEASKLCTKVLEVDPFNIKALYRRTQAYVRTSELEKAEEDIKRALIIDPNNRDVKLVQKKLKDKQRECVKFQTEIFSSMLAKMSN